MHVVVPLKDFAAAKRRLAGCLDSSERSGLFRAMVGDVLLALSQARHVEAVTLLSDDPIAASLAAEFSVELMAEASIDVSAAVPAVAQAGACERLNTVLTAAVSKLASAGIGDVMILHGDLPLLCAADVDALIETYRSANGAGATGLVIAADRAGSGTNSLLFPTASVPRLCFGQGSFIRHWNEAEQAGLQAIKFVSTGTATDIDEPDDLQAIFAAPSDIAVKSRAFLLQHAAHLQSSAPISEIGSEHSSVA